MILKGSQRGGARQLADHLLNDRDNDHVTLQELRGFVSNDLRGAMAEAYAVSRGTRCRQCVFSLSLNPPKNADVSLEALLEAADRAESALSLQDQPRAIIVHEKNGRRHAHVVWSRIDPTEMKAINLPHFKNRLRDLSRELYLEHGWELPEGHRTNGWKNPLNFTLAEWQQAKRLNLDPREIKQVFRSAWEQSDNLASFRNALEEHGYFLAKGDQRGLVAIDVHGEVFAVARWTGIKTKDATQKLGKGDGLPGVDQTRADIRRRMSKQLRGFIIDDRKNKTKELKPFEDARRRMVVSHKTERGHLREMQEERWNAENKERAGRFKRGLSAVLDLLTGRMFAVRKQNEREAFDGYRRDQAQRERLFAAQMKERAALQERIDAVQARHRQERMRLARRMAAVLWDRDKGPVQTHRAIRRARERSNGLELEP